MSRSTKNSKNKRKTRIYSTCENTLQRRRKKSVQEYLMKAIILVILIIIFAAVHGFKKGIIKEIDGMISLVVTLFVMSLVIMLYTSFRNNKEGNMVLVISNSYYYLNMMIYF